MAHLPLDTLLEKQSEIEKKLKIGDRYRHYKNHHTYKIHSIALREEDDTFSVNYQDEASGMIFNRKTEIFLAQVSNKNGKMLDRFKYIGGNK
jgi:hypothetical protein